MKLAIVVCLALCGFAAAADFNPRRALLDHLIERSDCEVPPQPEALPVKVQVSMKLMRIIDVCPEIHCVKIFALEMYNWTDPRLKWNPENYGGIDYMPVDIDHIWLPDIDIAGEKSGRSMRKRFHDDKATVLSSGSVLLIAPQKLELLCNGSVWQENLKSGGSKKSSSSSSNRIQQQQRDQRQRQMLQTRNNKFSSNGNDQQATYTCEFFQTSWMYDTDIVEVVPATPEEEEGQQSPRSRQMRIRQGGPSSNSEYDENEYDETSSTTPYPWRQQQQASKSRRPQQQQPAAAAGRSRRQQQNGGNGKQSKTSKKVPFSQWTSTASDELFDANEKFDLASFTAYRELTTLPYAPDRQWSIIYYRIGVIDKKPEVSTDGSSKKGKTPAASQTRRQNQEEEEREEEQDDEDDEEDTVPRSSSAVKLNSKKAELKRSARQQPHQYRAVNSYQEEEEQD